MSNRPKIKARLKAIDARLEQIEGDLKEAAYLEGNVDRSYADRGLEPPEDPTPEIRDLLTELERLATERAELVAQLKP